MSAFNMNLALPPALLAALAAPHTHRVVTRFESGKAREFTTRSYASASTYAVGERRKIGRDLIDRTTGATVRVIAVDIEEIIA